MGTPNSRKVIGSMVMHAAIAGVFFYVLQRYANKESLELSLAWAGFFAAAAALLAWRQAAR